jgi:alkanesulfonate monooxygenase SsuD/methylene tetrahydromethanopterin reductase-like flavin-dependent oxidoreductase (luciferase family)
MDMTRTLEATVDPWPIPAVPVTAFAGHGDEGRAHAGGGEDGHATPASIRHMIETIRRQLDWTGRKSP